MDPPDGSAWGVRAGSADTCVVNLCQRQPLQVAGGWLTVPSEVAVRDHTLRRGDCLQFRARQAILTSQRWWLGMDVRPALRGSCFVGVFLIEVDSYVGTQVAARSIPGC